MAGELETQLREAGFSEEAIASFVEAEDLPPPDARFQAKMDDQALTNAALAGPGAERDAYLEVTAMARDHRERFETEFSDVLNANADDDDGTEGAYEQLSGHPADSTAAYTAIDRRTRS